MSIKNSLLIIGSGPAGYTAAIYAARAGLNPILISGSEIGGQLMRAKWIDNFPGFPEPISGFELVEKMRKQVENFNVKILNTNIMNVDFSHRPFHLKDDNGNEFETQSVIIATGSKTKWLQAKGLDDYIGYGVSPCATCDGFFYRDKNVVVVGGGNTAVIEALHLFDIAKSVTIIHHRDTLSAEKIIADRLLAHKNINIEWNSIVDEIVGIQSPKEVTGIKFHNKITDEEKFLDVAGVFISIGSEPRSEIFKGHIDIDEFGYIKTLPNSAHTSIKGVFAAGDVQSPKFRQAILSAGNGCLAAMEARDFLAEQLPLPPQNFEE